MHITLIYTTVATEEQAQQMSKALVEKKWAACAVAFPVNSAFFWQGGLTKEPEFVVLAKTTTESSGIAVEQLERIHPYTLPCILTWNVNANEDYRQWVAQNVRT